MREIKNVIDQLLEVSISPSFNESLRSLKSSLPFTAPENMYIRWRELVEIIEGYCNDPPKFSWEKKIAKIIQDKKEE